jgi:uncharacterized protein YjbI with pentapeptide repeats
MKGILKAIMIVVGIAALVGGAIWAGYRYAPDWTGFGEYQTPSNPDIERARRLWDWLELLIVPFVLAVGALWFESRQGKTEREIAREKRQDATLEAYFDRMTALLLEEGLRDSEEGDEVRTIARSRTLSVLRRLDGKRKAEVVQFLQEADLIHVDSSIVDLSEAILREADLRESELQRAKLSKANLRNVDLWSANLWSANLRWADLQWADLQEANLSKANLWRADLRGSNLRKADLRKADLRDARNLDTACFEGANLAGTKVLRRDVEYLKRAGADLSGVKIMEESDEG